jgi:hypothetical protein
MNFYDPSYLDDSYEAGIRRRNAAMQQLMSGANPLTLAQQRADAALAGGPQQQQNVDAQWALGARRYPTMPMDPGPMQGRPGPSLRERIAALTGEGGGYGYNAQGGLRSAQNVNEPVRERDFGAATRVRSKLEQRRQERALENAQKWAGSADPARQRRGYALLDALAEKQKGAGPALAPDGSGNITLAIQEARKLERQFPGMGYGAAYLKSWQETQNNASEERRTAAHGKAMVDAAGVTAGGKDPLDTPFGRMLAAAKMGLNPNDPQTRAAIETGSLTPTAPSGTPGLGVRPNTANATPEQARSALLEDFTRRLSNDPGLAQDRDRLKQEMDAAGVTPNDLKSLAAGAQPGMAERFGQYLSPLIHPLAPFYDRARMELDPAYAEKKRQKSALARALQQAAQGFSQQQTPSVRTPRTLLESWSDVGHDVWAR